MRLPRHELLAGDVDGVNRVFATALDYVPGSLVPILNGQTVLEQGFAEQPPRGVQLEYPPKPGDQVVAYYVSL